MRDQKRLFVRMALVSTGVALAGCTSILGDYDLGTATPLGEGGLPDGSTTPPDGGVSDGSIGPDGVAPDVTAPPIDAAPGDGSVGEAGGGDAGTPYTCAFRSKGPIVVDTYGGAQPGGGGGAAVLTSGPQVVSVGANLARIVVRKPQSTAFTVYTVDKNARAVVPLTSTAAEMPLAAQPVAGGVGVLTSRVKTTSILGGATGPIGTTTNLSLYLYTLLDSSGSQAVLGTPLQLMGDTTLGGGVAQSGGFTSLVAANDYAFALAAGAAGSFVLLDGRASGGAPAMPSTVTTGSAAFTSPSVLRDAVADRLLVYLKNGPDGKGAVVFAMSATGAPTKTTAPRALSGPGGVALLLDTGGTALGGGYDHAFLETAAGSAALGGTLRVGQVTQAALDSFRATDLPQGPTLSAAEVPADKGMAQFFGDDFAAIGKAAKTDGLNFVWVGVDGAVHAKQVGPSALLPGRASAPGYSAVSLAQKGKTGGASWNVVWSETTTPSNGGQVFDTLYMDELSCQ